jgi:hypothetical protein
MSSQTYLLPDLFDKCPLTFGLINPHQEVAGEESKAWIRSYNILSPHQQAIFDKTNFELIASRAYPHADFDRLRIACDFLNLLIVFEELCNDQDGRTILRIGETWFRAMRDPEWDDHSNLANIIKECVG